MNARMKRYVRVALAMVVALMTSGGAARAALVTYYALDGTGTDDAGSRDLTLANGAAFSGTSAGFLGGMSLDTTADTGGNSQATYDVTGGDSLSGSWSVSIWAQAPSSTGTFIGTRGPSDESFDAKFSGGTLHGDIGRGAGWIDTSADGLIPGGFVADSWFNITYAVSTTGYALYINATLVSTEGWAADTPLLFNASHDIALGVVSAGGGEELDGLIDDVGLFDETLSEGEAKAIYNLAVESDLGYDVAEANVLFELHEAGSGNTLVNGLPWLYATGLSGGLGVVQQIGDIFFLQLDADGTGVRSLPPVVPEPSTWALLGLGVLGLGWRVRRQT